MPHRLFCATSNPGKLAEFRAAAPAGLELAATGLVDCQETGASFEENAIQKALCYAAAMQNLVFADDSGIVVDVLDGAPGIHSARFAGPGATDAENNALLLEKLQPWHHSAGPLPAARFVCAIALARPDHLMATFHGEAAGRILPAPRGQKGFGYDPLFYFPPLDRTFAELAPEEKFLHSHRGQAFRALLTWLDQHPEAFGRRPGG
jgi:XTP/dITP diphosphohydrolase